MYPMTPIDLAGHPDNDRDSSVTRSRLDPYPGHTWDPGVTHTSLRDDSFELQWIHVYFGHLKALTGLDRESAHLLQLHAVK